VDIAFEKAGGLVPAIVQHDRTGDVLMLGFMNEEALAETRRTHEVVFFSRSRNRLWKKGESSGHVLKVRDVRVGLRRGRSSCPRRAGRARPCATKATGAASSGESSRTAAEL